MVARPFFQNIHQWLILSFWLKPCLSVFGCSFASFEHAVGRLTARSFRTLLRALCLVKDLRTARLPAFSYTENSWNLRKLWRVASYTVTTDDYIQDSIGRAISYGFLIWLGRLVASPFFYPGNIPLEVTNKNFFPVNFCIFKV